MSETFVSTILLKRMALGEHNAFRSFYDITYRVVYRFIHYFISNKEDCEEVVSEVFYIVWRQRETLPDINDFKSWLYVVCRNEAFHYIRQKEKYVNLSIDDVHIELSIDPSSVDGKLIEEEMQKTYNAAVTRLPERCKLIFLMVREERLKYKEIAGILAISEGTVEQQMSIAIKKIITMVREHYPDVRRRNKKC